MHSDNVKTFVVKKIVCNKMHLRDIGWEGGNCIHVPQNGQVVSSCEHGNQHVGSLKCRESLTK
jgi:hypothetical protein